MTFTLPHGFAVTTRPLSNASTTPLSLSAFKQQLEREFVEGSAVDPALYQATIQIVRDLEVAPGGEVSTPIHDALGWHYARFGIQAQPNFYAALLNNEDGSTWQAKLSTPRTDKRGNVLKYESPRGAGSSAFLPAVPFEIRQRIQSRYGSTVPSSGSFWNWLEANPQIPIVITEGGKKSLAGLSQGYVSLALLGCNGGYRSKDGMGHPVTPSLIPTVERFVTSGRQFILAFDQDEHPKTRRRVVFALSRFGHLLAAQGSDVRVAIWNTAQGKGLDDLIVRDGAIAWDRAYQTALSFHHWHLRQQLENRLTYPVNLKVTSADLSTLPIDQMPEQGIIGIQSAKGTGKTKLISALLDDSERSIAVGHRIALMRNLCSRLGLNYRGDLDKVGHNFIAGAAYTLRVGLCVDSVLAIDPQTFAGCDLILDEAVQVMRHLLTSATCAREGKRPALLARFKELVQSARRVIVADADLNNATLGYLKQLREDRVPIFLIRNDYQPNGYPVRFIEAPDRSCIVDDLLVALSAQSLGKTFYIATDSKSLSKMLFRLIQQHYPDKRILMINSDTSKGDREQAFMQNPDAELTTGHYDAIICSPSVATGVSIEVQGRIAKVYGIFTGTSSTDADMAQALGRVREPVERVVWCAKVGNNFSPVSRSTHPQELKRHLYEQTCTAVSLIRSGLRQDTYKGLEGYDWRADPHLNLYCQISAAQNKAMYQLRDALLVRLRYEGNSVNVESHDSNRPTKQLLSAVRLQEQRIEAQTLLAAEDLTYAELLQLEQQETITSETKVAIAKFYLKEFYSLNTLTLDDVMWDGEGQRRAAILNLEDLLFPHLPTDRAAKSLEKQARWGRHLCPWDVSNAPLRRRLRQEIGLDQLLQKICSGWNYTRYDLAAYAAKARALAPAIKVALHLTITNKMSDVQIVHQLLAQMGIRIVQLRWSRSIAGHQGEKLRVYGLDVDHWRKIWAVLERRHQKRQRLQRVQQNQDSVGSPVGSKFKHWVGDPAQDLAKVPKQWFTSEAIAQIKAQWVGIVKETAAFDLFGLKVPVPLLRYIGLVS